MRHLNTAITERDERLAQVAMLTGFALIGYWLEWKWGLLIIGALGGVFLFVPRIGRWLVQGWYGVSAILGWVNSRMLLSLIFFGLLVPLALLRRLFRGDVLKLSPPKDTDSLWVIRHHMYAPKDFDNPW